MSENTKNDESKNEIKNSNNSSNEIFKNVFRTLTDSAIIISITTAALYFVSFFYLKGFYSYYGLIDLEIDFSIFRILKTCLEIFQSLFSWVVIFSLVSLGMTALENNPDFKSFCNNLWIFLLFSIFFKTSRYTTDSFFHIFYTVLAFSLISLVILAYILINILPDKATKKVSSFLDRRNNNNSLHYIYKIIIFINSLLIIINFIPKYGYNEARIKKDYLYDAQNQRVLIYQDNEKSIFLPKNKDDTFEKKYVIVSSSELSNIVFEHYEKEIVFDPKNEILRETPNIQDKQINNALTGEPIKQNSQLEIE